MLQNQYILPWIILVSSWDCVQLRIDERPKRAASGHEEGVVHLAKYVFVLVEGGVEKLANPMVLTVDPKRVPAQYQQEHENNPSLEYSTSPFMIQDTVSEIPARCKWNASNQTCLLLLY